MNKEERKLFDDLTERILQSATTEEQRERFLRTKQQADEMPRLMEAFDAWCLSQQIRSPIQAVLCAYVLGRNIGNIKNQQTRHLISGWLCNIVNQGARHD